MSLIPSARTLFTRNLTAELLDTAKKIIVYDKPDDHLMEAFIPEKTSWKE